MADLTKKIIFIVLYWIAEIRFISAHYCEWNLCTEDEECCGPMLCCLKPSALSTYPYDIFYIIAWILSGSMIIIIFYYILLRYKKYVCQRLNYQIGEKIVETA